MADGDYLTARHAADADLIRQAWARPTVGFSDLVGAALRTLERAETAEAIERAVIARAEAAETDVANYEAAFEQQTEHLLDAEADADELARALLAAVSLYVTGQADNAKMSDILEAHRKRVEDVRQRTEETRRLLGLSDDT